MRVRSITAVVVLAAAVGMVLFAGQMASGKTVIHVVSAATPQNTKFVDIGHDGLRLGDRVAARGPLENESGERVGTSYLQCVVHKAITNETTGLYNCNYTLKLADGELMLSGLDPRGPGSAEFAVLGGTGAYAGATGDATFTDTDSQTDMEIRLSN